MEGAIIPVQKHIWKVEDLTVTRVENERSSSRLNTDVIFWSWQKRIRSIWQNIMRR